LFDFKTMQDYLSWGMNLSKWLLLLLGVLRLSSLPSEKFRVDLPNKLLAKGAWWSLASTFGAEFVFVTVQRIG
jgi:hypothetical protein